MAGSLPQIPQELAEVAITGTTDKGALKKQKLKLAIISSRWNTELVQRLTTGAKEALDDLQIEDTSWFYAPGAFELPYVAKEIARIQQYDAIITFGVVIRGETTHYELVSEMCAKGIAEVSLEAMIPIIFGVLATENEEQVIARTPQDKTNKGYEAVLTAVEMVTLCRKIRKPAAAFTV